jgi:hypothetical protein
MEFVTRRDGLREAVMPDGKPAFQDRFTSFRDRDGSERRVIERTRYARWSRGRPEYDARPVVRQYDVGQIRGAPTAYYRPSRYEPGYYRSYYSRFAVPVALAAAAGTAWVVFGSPATSYTDPVSLMGDMQIASGFEDGYAYAMPSGATPVYDTPEAAALRSQMAAVQQQVNTSVQRQAAGAGRCAGGWIRKNLPVPDGTAIECDEPLDRGRVLPEHRRSDRLRKAAGGGQPACGNEGGGQQRQQLPAR